MPWATGLKFYNVIADPKVHEKHIKQNTLNETVLKIQDLLSSDKLKVAITQLQWATGLQFSYVIVDPKVAE